MNDLDEVMDPFKMQDLDDLICLSICQIPEGELRRKIANCILICGGGCQVIQTVDEIEDRLIDTFSTYDPTIERVEVINPLAREVPPFAASWVGGTVIQRLESMKELWITGAKWTGDVDNDSDDDDFLDRKIRRDKAHEAVGVKILREKLPFLW
jgi:actin-related protein